MRAELLEAIRERYRGATRSEKQRILDDFIFDRQYHRKDAISVAVFDDAGGPNLDKHSAVLGLVQSG
jgi:hypothetical protein